MSTGLPAIRLPSKCLRDLELDEGLYKADFELSSRYDLMAKEVQRLALLGIGAYGFFVTKAGMDKSGDPTQALSGFVRHPTAPIAGLLAFAVSAGAALYCSYLNSKCLKLQIDILRLLGRSESGRWDGEQEREINATNLALDRRVQRKMLQEGRTLMFVAVTSLMVGAGATVLSFVVALFQAHQAG